MRENLNRRQISKGAYFNWVTNDKFKLNRTTVYFYIPLNLETASNYSSVPLMLRKGSENHADFTELNAELNRLYGASLSADVGRYNGYQQISLSITSIDNAYAMNSEDITAKSAKLLMDLIFNPKLDENGVFPKKEIDLERKYLMDTIEGEINDKREYAIERALTETFGDSPVALPKYGTLETAKAITPESVTKAWKQLLQEANIEVFFTGAGNPDSALEIIEKSIKSIKRNPVDFNIIEPEALSHSGKQVEEIIPELQQGKLVLTMTTGKVETEKDHATARMLSAVYGGTPFSKLFLNVRERLSLCYYCAARFNTVNQLIIVDSGVETQNKEKAEAEVLEQLKKLKAGEISQQELDNTKLLLTNAIATTEDTLSGTETWYLVKVLNGRTTSPREDIEIINSVTSEDIVKLANTIELSTVYFLTGKGGSVNA